MRVKNHKRLAQIKELIDQEGYVSVESLSSRFGCSPATIRRDLQELERLGSISRTHGGAYGRSAQSIAIGAPPVNEQSFGLIARRALELIRPGDTIYLDPGIFTEQLALQIRTDFTGDALTVITSSMVVFMQLAECANLDLFLLGGQYQRATRSFNGPTTQRALADLMIEKYFMTTSGIVPGYGLTEADQTECEVKRAVLNRARKAVLLADLSRFRARGLYLLAPLSSVQQIVTDDGLSVDQRQLLNEEGVEVIIASA